MFLTGKTRINIKSMYSFKCTDVHTPTSKVNDFKIKYC